MIERETKQRVVQHKKNQDTLVGMNGASGTPGYRVGSAGADAVLGADGRRSVVVLVGEPG